MRIKSYFVKSIDEAIGQARKDLGEEALLLNTRKGSSPDGSWVGYEVVFGCAEDPATGPVPVMEPKPAEYKEDATPAVYAAPAAAGADTHMSVAVPATVPVAVRPQGALAGREAAPDLDKLRAQMDEIHGLLLSSGSQRAVSRGLPFLDGVFSRLMKAGWSAPLAGSVVEAVAAALSPEAPAPSRKTPVSIGRKNQPQEQGRIEELLRRELGGRVKIDPSLGVPGSLGTVVAMVGPGGAGKTTMLMKIAAFQADPIRPVRLLTLDRSGLGSRMHLQMFARKTRIAFTPVESPEALPALIEEARKTELVLVDTPGHLEPAERRQLASILTRCPGVDVHLVLPAYMTAGATREAIHRYAPFWPSKLAVTRLDETTSFGALVPEAVEAGLSLSLISDGVSIPDSLHACSLEDLMILALGRESAEAACA
jgi:flagellar biosynthesis protein FlhF